jgi:hypothetical protein
MPEIKHTGLRRIVGRTLRAYGGLKTEHTVTRAVVSDYLLEKLLFKDPNLPPGKLGQAKRLAEHSARLSEAISFAQTKQQIPAKNATKILQITMNEMPKYLERNEEKLGKEGTAQFAAIQKKLMDKLIKVENLPEEQAVELSLPFLKIANMVHLDTMRSLLGEKKFMAYARAMVRAMKTVMERKKKPNTQKG